MRSRQTERGGWLEDSGAKDTVVFGGLQQMMKGMRVRRNETDLVG